MNQRSASHPLQDLKCRWSAATPVRLTRTKVPPRPLCVNSPRHSFMRARPAPHTREPAPVPPPPPLRSSWRTRPLSQEALSYHCCDARRGSETPYRWVGGWVAGFIPGPARTDPHFTGSTAARGTSLWASQTSSSSEPGRVSRRRANTQIRPRSNVSAMPTSVPRNTKRRAPALDAATLGRHASLPFLSGFAPAVSATGRKANCRFCCGPFHIPTLATRASDQEARREGPQEKK